MWKKTSLLISLLSLIFVGNLPTAQAQEIKIDGDTATIVTRDGNRITIDGNTLSRDGKNLFHSFQEFGLTPQQIATFLTNPNIQNILTRVTGGNPSYIQGLIEVTGGNSNLFIMNPAGIVFGQGASLNVPADFTATTATGIGFANGMFNAVGSNDYQYLIGNPNSFIFNTDKAGSIINAGYLAVTKGQNFTLIGGNVINTGTIETPDGKINIQGVEGTSRIKITPEGSLLSLEIDIPEDEQGNLLGFTPQDLPTLLTGANSAGVSTPNVTVTNNQVQVANANIPEGTGSSIISGEISTSSENLGGEITILGDKVGVIEGEISANGDNGGGKVLIGGDREGKGTIPNAEVTYISPDSKISADATVNGDGGEIIVFAEDYANINGELTAKGGNISGDGGFIETSGKKSFNITSIPDTRAVNGIAGEWLIDPLNVSIVSGLGDIIDSGGTFTPPGSPSNTVGVDSLKFGLFSNNIVTVTTGTTGTEEGNITWESEANLDFDGIGTGKTLVLSGDHNIIYSGTIHDSIPDSSDSLNVIFNSNANNTGGTIDITGSITTGGGDLSLNAEGNIFTGNINTYALSGDGGDVNINSGNNIQVGNIDSNSPVGNGGNITLIGAINISTGMLFSEGDEGDTGGGDIFLSSMNGEIFTGILDTSSSNSNAGNVAISGKGNIVINGAIDTSSFNGGGINAPVNNGGNVEINSQLGSITINDTIFAWSVNPNFNDITKGKGGNVFLTAEGNINTTNIFTESNFATAGEVLINSNNGAISVNDIRARGNQDNNITLNSINTINTGAITFGNSNDNTVANGSLTIETPSIVTINGAINSNGADVIIGTATPSEVNINGSIDTNGGNITISSVGNINTSNIIDTASLINSGNVTFNALGSISVEFISTGDPGGNDNLTRDTGNVTLNAESDIAIGFINTYNRGSGVAGNVTLTAGESIISGGIDAGSSNGDGGAVIIRAGTGLTVIGQIYSGSGSLAVPSPSLGNGFGGTIDLITTDGDISTSSLQSTSFNGTAGNINVNSGGNVKIGNIFTNNGSVDGNGGNVTISSTGLIKIDSGESINSISSGTGNVVLNHRGGGLNPRVPFIVGDATVNGTSGSIVTATESINPVESYSNSFISPNGTIQINTTNFLDLPIVAATLELDGDNTGSIVSSQDGLLIDITGGTLSGNGSNLFHSFTRFDLPQSDQTANFITETSGINNILARVISGDASIINGQIQVTGLSNANLYLMNPAGIVFGNTATLNVPADFIATTATGIGFGDNWFSANGDYNASLLNVDPVRVAFTATESGGIINASSLSNANGSVGLLGGTVINSENMSNNSGNLGFSAIQGQNILNLNDFTVTPSSESATLPNNFTPPILTLENLVNTALSEGSGNLGVTILDTNSLQVDGSGVTVNLGDISTANINANNTNISASNNVTLGAFGDNLGSNSSSLNLNANGQLELLGTFTPQGGNTSILGVSNFISPNNINTGGGNFNLETTGDFTLNFAMFTEGGDFTLNSLGNVNINSGIDTDGGIIDVSGLSVSSSLDVITPFDSSDLTGDGGNITLTSTNGDVNVNGLSSNSSTGNGGIFSVSAVSGNITIGNVNTLGGTTGNLTLTADGNILNNGEIIVGGDTFLSGNDITLDNSANDFQTVAIAPANNVILADSNDLTLANTDIEGNITTNLSISGNLDLRVIDITNINSNIEANSILTDNLGATLLNGNITTTGNQTYQEEVIIGDAIALSGDNLDFANTVNSETGETNNLTVNGNNATFNQAIGNNQALGDLNLNVSGETQLNQVTANSLTTDNVGTTLLNGNVTTTGNQTYNDNLTIPSDVTSLSNQGSLNFNGEVNASNNLTLISLSGINFADSQNITGNNSDLTLQTIGDRTINIGNIANQFSITNLDQVNGFANIFIGGNTTPTINVNETLTVNDPLTLTANNINVNQAITGNDNASITIKGNRTTTTLNADITTQGNAITIDDNVLLGNDITLSTNSSRGSADIDILGTINGNHDLILNANGSDIFIRGAIGSSSRLNNLETNASLTTLNGSSILTNGSQIFNSDIELGANTTFDTPESFNSQNISSENNNLTISAQTINTENINTNGGNVNLNSKADGDIQVNTINTSNPEGRGGDVEITTAGNFRATGAENGISINTNGGEGGVVTIDLFPGDLENQVREDTRLPFIVGDGTENGTAGIIANNNFTIGNGEYFITTQRGNLELKLLGRLPSVEGTENVQQPPITPPVEVAIAPPILPIATIDQAQEILTAIERESTEKPALIYVSFTPKGFQPQDLENEFARREATNTQEYSRVNITKANLQPTVNLPPAEDDQLDILIVTQDEKPLRMVIPVTRKQVLETAGNLWAKTSDVFALDDSYKPYASDMYNWLIKPIEKELEAREISNLLFILPTEMRFIPVAALYDADNQQFLVEKYSSGLAPSLNLNDNRYRPLKDAGLLAMGASTFADSGVVPLPAAGLELPSIRQVWTGERPDNYQEYLNENFTLEQIKNNLNRQPFGIVHFGTHGDFNPTDTNESFLQLYDSRLNIRELSRLGLNDPLVELLVLSACETAFGNEIAELGFAGLAVQAGVKTAMGSVWQVSDTGTLALMTDFYGKLKNTTTKAEALRQAQLDMLKGRVYKTNDGNTIVTPNLEISLDTLPDTSRFPEDFSHPFYWAPFTMIGNPW